MGPRFAFLFRGGAEMVQQTKQCAGCGAQMGARGRACPRCGRGSLFGELVWIVVLGVLLLGIGILSCLVPLDQIREVTHPSVARTGREAQPSANQTRSAPVRSRKIKAKREISTSGSGDSGMAYAPCAGSDRQEPPYPGGQLARGPHAPPANVCSDNHLVTPESLPESTDTSLAHQH
jgi:hypothetical protein